MKIHRPQIQNHQKSEQKKPRLVTDEFQYVPDDHKKVAQGLEQQFTEYMLEQMKKSIGSSESGTAIDYYKDLNKTEQAKMLSGVNNGLGIQKVILDEIYPQKFRNPEAFAAYNEYKSKGLMKKPKVEMAGPPAPKEIEKHDGISIGREASNE